LQTIDGLHVPISLLKLVVTWFDSLWMQQSFVSDSAVLSAFKSNLRIKIWESFMVSYLRFKWSSIMMTLYAQLWLPSNNSNECLWFLLSIVSCSQVSSIWIFDMWASFDSEKLLFLLHLVISIFLWSCELSNWTFLLHFSGSWCFAAR